MRKLLYVFFAIIAISACTKGGDDIIESNDNDKGITLNTNKVSFVANGGSRSVTFATTEAWTAEVKDSDENTWCVVAPTSGAAGTAEITLTVEVNETTDDRSAIVVIKAGSESESIAVTQAKVNLVEVERKALIEFYKATDGPNWKYNENWGTNKPLNEWYGITTNGQGLVTQLQLSENNLKGSIPESIGKLEHLKRLNVYKNNLTGNIPESLMQLNVWATDWFLILSQSGDGFSMENVVIPAPKFKEMTINDEELDYSVYAENEYTILYNYFSSSQSAKQFTPTLVDLYRGYKSKGLEVIAFSGSGTKMSHEAFAKQFDTEWPYILLNNDADMFYSHTLVSPAVSVVDKNGYIVFNHATDSYGDLAKFLRKHLGDPNYELYESTDFSKDGEVKLLQAASKGKGIDIVLMGDAFSDRLINDGTYDKTMNTAMEKFFEVEPYKSFRDFFNVYSVTAVSKNEVYTGGIVSTAISGYFGDGTRVGGEDEKAFAYALKAIGEERMDADQALIVVMMNSKSYAGTCYMYYPTIPGDWGNGITISYFPIGYNENELAKVLHHETGGHGFPKLGDEYAYEDYGAIPENEINSAKEIAQYGWYKNVDFTNNTSLVKWAHFLNDSRYAYEGLGVYEGAFTYWTGAYRPTKNSIMNNNTGGFNAPSREAIYYRIHKLAYGPEWVYDYEAFVEWDTQKGKTAAGTYGVPYKPTEYKPTHKPIVIKKSWRDAK